MSEDSFVSQLLDGELLAKVSGAKDATEALEIIADKSGTSGGVVEVNDCRLIVSAALERNNAELALSVFYAMRASFDNCTYEVYVVQLVLNIYSLFFNESFGRYLDCSIYNKFLIDSGSLGLHCFATDDIYLMLWP